MTFDFYAFMADAERRKSALGIDQSPSATDALRNKGGRRTPRKRALLARAAARSGAAGRTPVAAYY